MPLYMLRELVALVEDYAMRDVIVGLCGLWGLIAWLYVP